MNTPVFNQQNTSSAPMTSGPTAVPPQQPVSATPAPSFTPKTKKSVPISTFIGVLIFALVSIGAVVTMYLNGQKQDIRQQASTGDTYGGIQCCVNGKQQTAIDTPDCLAKSGGVPGVCGVNSGTCDATVNCCNTNGCNRFR
jgi:hypothetical protein